MPRTALSWEEIVDHHHVERTRLPKLQNTDGDPLLLTNDRFDFDADNRQRLEALIAEMAEPQDDGAEPVAERVFVFYRPGNAMHKNWDNTIVGRAVVGEHELVLETNSVRRADDLRAQVEAALHTLVRHRARDHQDPEAMFKLGRDSREKRPAAIEKDEPRAPEMLQALRDFKRQHFESWLDTPIPALAGMTPREAAAKPRKRNEVVVMLKEIENHESRIPADERIDVSKLWGELGLRDASR